MRSSVLFFWFSLTIFRVSAQNKNEMKEYTMLCLGDSYTIGEQVDEADRFPNQTVLFLHSKGIYFEKPKIIATTGWTTDELMAAIHSENLKGTYDFVTLLIGVNNQYRGRSLDEFRNHFDELLNTAFQFSGENKTHIVVLSIPDWGTTSFAEGRDRKKIATEIDQFNEVCKTESLKFGAHYIDITESTREHSTWLAPDGLHPSGKEYALWANDLVTVIEGELQK